MGLSLNANEARKADNFSTVLRESGKYVGIITRAEKLLSRNNVEGVGFSFKTDDGASASFLDVYTVKPNSEKLRGYNVVQAILCCARLKTVSDGQITFDRWDGDQRKMVQATALGYPELMGKRIGLVLQREIGTNDNTGNDTDRLNIFAVFEASTGLMASEILDQKTKPEKLENIVQMVMRNPVRDTRKRAASSRQSDHPNAPGNDLTPFDDSIPF